MDDRANMKDLYQSPDSLEFDQGCKGQKAETMIDSGLVNGNAGRALIYRRNHIAESPNRHWATQELGIQSCASQILSPLPQNGIDTYHDEAD